MYQQLNGERSGVLEPEHGCRGRTRNRWWRSVLPLALVWPLAIGAHPLTVATSGENPTLGAPLDFAALSFLLGDWETHWERLPGEDISKAQEVLGFTRVSWGGDGAWLELHGSHTLPGGEKYDVVVLVAPRAGSDELRAFVMNSHSSGAEYRGRIREDGVLEFETTLGAKVQRVTYSQLPGDRVRFYVEESVERSGPVPHSQAVWVRAPRPSAEHPEFRALPRLRLYSRSVVGPYSLHPEVLQELLGRAETIGAQPSQVVALYLSDPRKTESDDLRWSLGFVLDEAFDDEIEPPFELIEIPGQDVVSLQTPLESLGAASQRIDEWMGSAGLRQSGPTRVIWTVESGEPRPGLVKLIKPVTAE